MFKIVVFIPMDQKEDVKTAMFNAGGGRIGQYDWCCFELEGIGQFRPLEGSDPYIGQTNQVEKVREVRVEMVCADIYLEAVVAAMKQAHPYETVAYDVIRLVNC